MEKRFRKTITLLIVISVWAGRCRRRHDNALNDRHFPCQILEVTQRDDSHISGADMT